MTTNKTTTHDTRELSNADALNDTLRKIHASHMRAQKIARDKRIAIEQNVERDLNALIMRKVMKKRAKQIAKAEKQLCARIRKRCKRIDKANKQTARNVARDLRYLSER